MSTTSALGFESKLWAAADALRNNMDAAEYKHVVLGLIFLKYISDAFESKHAELESQRSDGADPEDPDEYRAAHIFWVPKEARWQHLKASAPQPKIGTFVDDAMAAIERDNPSLKGVLPKDYARPGLDKQRLGQLINLISDVGLGTPADRAKDVLGCVYEYFLSQFASAEGKKGGQFTRPRTSSAFWWRCSRPTRAVSTIPAAAPVACLCRAGSSLRRTAAESATSPSTGKSRTIPPGGWPR